ncbi:hypothetical protein ACFST9_18550 [Hymenobacter monticola]|uniref:Lipoprotein n=1 Tax=Hymenobacter monticola TaxID=1705399 RepID=A0ABY4AYX8_9BACT|nr:hypothetical protein [Hymenobacter monticola]UOE32091.1 hypothetical protein MTP16_13215 [Hymenobacter monticola]
MSKHFLFAALSLSLFACKKNDAESPAAVAAGFSQDFALLYRQQASLPQPAQPELTITVTDLQFSICPRNANCFMADYARPTLRITDAQGGTQQLTMPVILGSRSADWIDTTSVRANGRRYVLTYLKWQVPGDYHAATKENIKLTFRVD